MKTFYLTIAAFFFSIISASVVDGQPLSDLEKNTLVEYWDLDPKLSGFSGAAKEKVLNDRANANNLRVCFKADRKHKVLMEIRNLAVMDLDKMYEKIATNFTPAFLKSVFGGYNNNEFLEFKAIASKIEQKAGGR